MKKLSLILLSLFLITAHANDPKLSYGKVNISAQIVGLDIIINEIKVGETQKKVQTFALPINGVKGKYAHEIIIKKELSETQQLFFKDEIHFNQYIDVEKSPVATINLFKDAPKNTSYPEVNFQIAKRLKPAVLAKKTGLLAEVKLKHNSTWHMSWDGKQIYILTRAYNDLYRSSENETVQGQFLEIYDRETLAFIKEKRLSYKNHDTFDEFMSVGVDDKSIYIGKHGYLKYLDKTTLEEERRFYTLKHGYMEPLDDPAIKEEDAELAIYAAAKILDQPQQDIDGIIEHNGFIIAYGEGDRAYIYKDKQLIYSLDQKQNYPENITQIKDYWDYNRINNLNVFAGKLYTTNHRGFINIYDFATGKFLEQINTIAYDKEWKYVVGSNIEDLAIYQNRYIYFSQDYQGLIIYDTKTGKRREIETLFPKEIVYDQRFKREIDLTKATSIYKMVFYKDNLIFSEVNARYNFVYIYSLTKDKIIHTFKGHQGEISEMILAQDKLIGLSSAGYLYKWKLDF